MTTLISFLGKSRKDPATGYQRASYQFAGGEQVQTTFFGAALMQRLRPQRTLLLGTAGSMWDVLDLDVESNEWSELGEATERGEVNQPLLDRAERLAKKLGAGDVLGRSASRSDVLRAAIETGLAALERKASR